MKYLIISLMLLLATNFAKSQESNSTDSVKAVINQLFTAMKNADSVLLKQCFHNDAILETIVTKKDGSIVVLQEKKEQFFASVGRLGKGDADERIEFKIVLINKQLASVWTPYQFYYKGQFSHCGVNSFQLVFQKEGWRIKYLIDTRYKDDCAKNN
ncbi:MAG: hypothetical protein ACOVQE_04135 [Chitinophagaceae bacterium]